MIVTDEPGPAASHLLAGLELVAGAEAGVTILRVTPPRRWRLHRIGPSDPISCRLDPYDDPTLLELRRVAWGRGVAVKIELRSGEGADCIVRAARADDADVIVLRRSPLGERVARLSGRPVLLVPRAPKTERLAA